MRNSPLLLLILCSCAWRPALLKDVLDEKVDRAQADVHLAQSGAITASALSSLAKETGSDGAKETAIYAQNTADFIKKQTEDEHGDLVDYRDSSVRAGNSFLGGLGGIFGADFAAIIASVLALVGGGAAVQQRGKSKRLEELAYELKELDPQKSAECLKKHKDFRNKV